MSGTISLRRGIAAPLLLTLFTLLTTFVSAPLRADTFLRFKVFPPDASIEIDGEPIELISGPEETRQAAAAPGPHVIKLSREGYRDALLFSSCTEGVNLVEAKLERNDSRLALFANLETGSQPKSVSFSPDGRYIYAPLLDGPGVDVFRVSDFSRIGRITLPGRPPGTDRSDNGTGSPGEPAGFVECAPSPRRDELWVSQMTTGEVHVFSLYGFRHLVSIDTGGEWSKVITIDSDERYAYVSNWLSRDVSIIDMESRQLIDAVPVGGVPRGMALSAGEEYLYVCLYEGGGIAKVDLSERKSVGTIDSGESAPRHIVRDPAANRFYVSDMLNGTLLVLDGNTDSLIRRIYVGPNPNTVVLSPDGKFLFVSTRGKNHPEGYLRKGHVFGKISVVDTESFEIVDWAWGGNQPTGLALSPDGRLLASTDFLDNRIEVYYVDRE